MSILRTSGSHRYFQLQFNHYRIFHNFVPFYWVILSLSDSGICSFQLPLLYLFIWTTPLYVLISNLHSDVASLLPWPGLDIPCQATPLQIPSSHCAWTPPHPARTATFCTKSVTTWTHPFLSLGSVSPRWATMTDSCPPGMDACLAPMAFKLDYSECEGALEI